MKNILFIFSFVFVVFSYSEEKTTNELKTESSSYSFINDTTDKVVDSLQVSNVFDSTLVLKSYRLWYKTVKEPVVFLDNSNVYSKPDTLSKHIMTLNFDSEIFPVENSQVTRWTQILYKKDTCYMEAKNLCFYTFPSNNGAFKYFLKESENLTSVYKYDLNEMVFIDSTKIEFGQPDDLKVFVTKNWENTDALFMLNRDGACCGCSNSQYYMIDANNTFDSVSFTNQWVDDGEGDAGYASNLSIPYNPHRDFVRFTEYEYSDYPMEVLTENTNQFGGDTVRFIEKIFKWNGAKLEKVDNTVHSK